MSRPARGACPNKDCKDHGIQGRENVVPHGFFKSKAGRAFYPWERALNSARFHPGRGFVEPPTFQRILLHPSMAFEMSNEFDDKLFETLVLEVADLGELACPKSRSIWWSSVRAWLPME